MVTMRRVDIDWADVPTKSDDFSFSLSSRKRSPSQPPQQLIVYTHIPDGIDSDESPDLNPRKRQTLDDLAGTAVATLIEYYNKKDIRFSIGNVAALIRTSREVLNQELLSKSGAHSEQKAAWDALRSKCEEICAGRADIEQVRFLSNVRMAIQFALKAVEPSKAR